MALSSLVVDLILRAGGFESDMNRASKTAERNAKRMQKSFADAGKKIGTALGAGITVAAVAITAGVKAAIDGADEISKASQKIGITTESLSALKLAGDLADVSFETLKSGVVKLADGLDTNAEALAAIGVKTEDATGNFVSMDAILAQVADVFKKMPDGVDKTRLAVELFGRAGADLIPLLNGGASGLDDMRAKSDALGVTLDSATGKAAENFNDQLTEMEAQMSGVFLSVARDLLPTMQDLATTIASPEFRDGFATIVRGMVSVAGTAADAITVLTGLGNIINQTFTSDAEKSLDGLAFKLVSLDDQRRLVEQQGFTSSKRIRDETLAMIDKEIEATQRLLAEKSKKPEIDRLISGAQFVDLSVTPSTAPGGKTGDQILDALKKRREDEANKSTAAAAERERAKQARDQARDQAAADKERTAAAEQFTEQAARMAAQIDGPLAEANLRYMDEQRRLIDLAKTGEISNAALADSLANLEKIRQNEADAINAQLTPGQQLLNDLQFEQALIESTSDERERAIVLRGLDAESIAQYGDQIAAANQKIIESREEIDRLDAVRSTASNFFADFAKNGISALDRLKDKITDLIFQQLGDQLAQSLFGQIAQSGGGSAGGFASILGGLFGGGSAKGDAFVSGSKVQAFASGGIVSRTTAFGMAGGKIGVAGEAGPEGVLPLRRTPDGKLGVIASGGGRGVVQNNTFVVEGRIDRRTQQQIVGATGRQINRATSRNG